MSSQVIIIAVLIAFLLFKVILALFSFKGEKEDTPSSYFLANRSLGTLVLFFTLVATNFSSFFFLGFPAQGYKIGYAYYAMIALGSSVAGLSFYFVGSRAYRLSKRHNFITPGELIETLSKSKSLKYIYLFFMLLYTIPYLALQPIGAGHLLETLTNGAVSFEVGATAITGFIVLYVFLGGMKSVANTDLIQGLLMFVLMFAAVYLITDHFGGITAVNKQMFEQLPELFARNGKGGYFDELEWVGLVLMWVLCVPMFPQMFMRFFVAKKEESLQKATVLYVLTPILLFLCPVIIGITAYLPFPDLTDGVDKVFPMLLEGYTNPLLSGLIMIGALAALMSTLDSQLLAASTMITRDVYLSLINPQASLKKQVFVGRLLIVVIALAGLMVAFSGITSIFELGKNAFIGFAALCPTVMALLWLKSVPKWLSISMVLIGESVVILSYFGLLSHPLIWIICLNSVYLIRRIR